MLKDIYVHVYPKPCDNLDFGGETSLIDDGLGLTLEINKTNKRNWAQFIALLSFNEAKTLEHETKVNKKTSTE